MTRGAVAIFVKTPGLSPVKTRLARAIGTGRAETFHRLAAAAVAAVVRRAAETVPLAPYWAVAESAALAHPLWSGFRALWQGDGDLGRRLSRVYDRLLAEHRFVLFLGADSPQITPDLLAAAAVRLGTALLRPGDSSARFVLGRAADGGFYLFGGSCPVPGEAWRRVRYSTPATADELARQLEPLGAIRELPPLRDVDTMDDLPPLAESLAALRDPLPEQRTLHQWLQRCLDS